MTELITRCPKCAISFRALPAHLKVANGLVRCGSCLHVFDAEAHRVEKETATPPLATKTAKKPKPQIKSDPLDNILISDDMNLDRFLLKDNTPQEDEQEPEPEKLQFQDSTATLELESKIQQANKRQWPWLILTILSLVALAAQYVFFHPQQVLSHPQLNTLAHVVAQQVGIKLPARIDLSAIHSTSLEVYTSSINPQHLRLDAVIVNQANFSQPFPHVMLSFEDLQGQTIAERRFKPIEYLANSPQQTGMMAPNTPVAIHLNLIDPGKQAVSYYLRVVK